MKELSNLARNIKIIRKSKKLTQIELSTECNLSESSICQYEKLQRSPSIEAVILISKALKTDIGKLFK